MTLQRFFYLVVLLFMSVLDIKYLYAQPPSSELLKVDAFKAPENFERLIDSQPDWQPLKTHHTGASGHWYRISLPPQSLDKPERYLVLKRHALWAANIYLPPNFNAQPLSMLSPPDSLGFSSENFVIPMPALTTDNPYAYLYVETGRLRNTISSQTAIELMQTEQMTRFYLAFFAGICAFGVIFSLMMYYLFRESVYLSFFTYLLATLLFFTTRYGSFFEYYWGKQIAQWYGSSFMAICVTILFITSMHFMGKMAELSLRTPMLKRAVNALIMVLMAILILKLVGLNFRPYLWFINFTYLLCIGVIIIAVATSAIQGSIYARFVLIGQALLIPVAVLLIIQALLPDIRTINESFWLPVSYAFEMVVFSTVLAYKALNYKKERDSALNMAHRDRLTGAPNRHALYNDIEKIKKLDAPSQQQTFVVLLDIDHFKKINDTYGHQAGDECLKAMSKLIQKNVRDKDCFYRYGGEEFLIILTKCSLSNARAICERIWQQTQKFQVECQDGKTIRFTVSMGISNIHEYGQIDNAIHLADKALYFSKSNGRDQIHVSEHLAA